MLVRRTVLALFPLVCLFLIFEPVFGGIQPDLQKIHALYDKAEYQKVLEELAKLETETSGVPDVRRLKIRTLVRLGNPKDALTEYDKLAQALQQDDRVMLREVALGFIVVLTKDMREQMRGAAYTALKEWQSPEAIPFFEEGLSDGSGLIRALAAEGLAKLETGRRSPKFRQALEDQAALVKEAVLKGWRSQRRCRWSHSLNRC
ncbi:MAG: HEAT repeat domain-containing protein [Nitrospira sp.]|nr:HEAT repeat domain-containing protein [Nitrospira sp.]